MENVSLAQSTENKNQDTPEHKAIPIKSDDFPSKQPQPIMEEKKAIEANSADPITRESSGQKKDEVASIFGRIWGSATEKRDKEKKQKNKEDKSEKTNEKVNIEEKKDGAKLEKDAEDNDKQKVKEEKESSVVKTLEVETAKNSSELPKDKKHKDRSQSFMIRSSKLFRNLFPTLAVESTEEDTDEITENSGDPLDRAISHGSADDSLRRVGCSIQVEGVVYIQQNKAWKSRYVILSDFKLWIYRDKVNGKERGVF